MGRIIATSVRFVKKAVGGRDWRAQKVRGSRRRRRRVTSAEGARVEAPRGGLWGGGIPLPSRLGGLPGERRELPQRVRGGAPAANAFLAHFRVTERL